MSAISIITDVIQKKLKNFIGKIILRLVEFARKRGISAGMIVATNTSKDIFRESTEFILIKNKREEEKHGLSFDKTTGNLFITSQLAQIVGLDAFTVESDLNVPIKPIELNIFGYTINLSNISSITIVHYSEIKQPSKMRLLE